MSLSLRQEVNRSTTQAAVCASRSTGKERDAESGNDYFSATYYASTMGRFMSPDWSAKEEPVPYADLHDPQSLNLYSYVRKNPLSKSDRDGHCDDKQVLQAFQNFNAEWAKIAATGANSYAAMASVPAVFRGGTSLQESNALVEVHCLRNR